MTKIFPILENDSDLPFNIKRTFGNLAVLTDGIIIDAQPDFYYNARPDQLDPFIQKKLNSYIIFLMNDRTSILFNNFTEGKGSGGIRVMADR
jgi:hypothetical protein